MKVLHLDYTDSDFFARQKQACGVDMAAYFDDYEGTIRRIRRFPLLLLQPFFSRLLARKWADSHREYDLIILGASFLTPAIIRFIRRTNRHSRIIVWYANSVAFDTPVHRFKGLQCELWSFDRRDCLQYGIQHNSQYYFDLPNPDVPRDIDAIFLGIDKGRAPIIREIEQKVSELGLSCKFHVVADKRSQRNSYPFATTTIEYGEYLKLVHRSSVIVDVMMKGQDGMTLRPLEALFHSRKLITNNRRIQEYDFYRPANVFLWGTDDPSTLGSFMASPYDEGVRAHSRHYAFDNWLQRFNEPAR